MKSEPIELGINGPDDIAIACIEMRDRYKENGNQIVVILNDNLKMVDTLRKLYWVFVAQVAKHTGHTKEEHHDHYKYRFLLRIFIRSPERHPKYENLISLMENIRENAPESFEEMKQLVIHGTHIKDAWEDELRELISDVEADGISLRVPFKISPKQAEMWNIQKQNG